MKVVSNTSVLIGLSTIGQLCLLRVKFPQGVLIPDAVWREVVVEGEGRAGSHDVSMRHGSAFSVRMWKPW